MPKQPSCYGELMHNVGNPNCDTCWCRQGCYEEWSRKDKEQQKRKEEQEKPWYEDKTVAEIFPEACDHCERPEN